MRNARELNKGKIGFFPHLQWRIATLKKYVLADLISYFIINLHLSAATILQDRLQESLRLFRYCREQFEPLTADL